MSVKSVNNTNHDLVEGRISLIIPLVWMRVQVFDVPAVYTNKKGVSSCIKGTFSFRRSCLETEMPQTLVNWYNSTKTRKSKSVAFQTSVVDGQTYQPDDLLKMFCNSLAQKCPKEAHLIMKNFEIIQSMMKRIVNTKICATADNDEFSCGYQAFQMYRVEGKEKNKGNFYYNVKTMARIWNPEKYEFDLAKTKYTENVDFCTLSLTGFYQPDDSPFIAIGGKEYETWNPRFEVVELKFAQPYVSQPKYSDADIQLMKQQEDLISQYTQQDELPSQGVTTPVQTADEAAM
jgi:hypothetical protein